VQGRHLSVELDALEHLRHCEQCRLGVLDYANVPGHSQGH
jgi:hypothetical protein